MHDNTERPGRSQRARHVFLFLPAAILAIYAMAIRVLIATMTAASDADIRAFGFMGPFFVLAPLAVICLIFVAIDLFCKRKGVIAALQGLAWNILLVATGATIIHFVAPL